MPRIAYVVGSNGTVAPVRADDWKPGPPPTLTTVTILSPVDMSKATDDEIVAAILAACEVAELFRNRGFVVHA